MFGWCFTDFSFAFFYHLFKVWLELDWTLLVFFLFRGWICLDLSCRHLMAVEVLRDRLRRIILLLEANYATLADCSEKALFVLCDQKFNGSLSQQKSRFTCCDSTAFHMYRCKMQGYSPKIPKKYVVKLKPNFVVFLMASCNQKSPSFRLGVQDLSRSVKIGTGWDGIQSRNANRRLHVGGYMMGMVHHPQVSW